MVYQIRLIFYIFLRIEIPEKKTIKISIVKWSIWTIWPYFLLFFRVKIMLPWDPQGKNGPKKPLPDHVSIVEPKEEVVPASPFSEAKLQKPDMPGAAPI